MKTKQRRNQQRRNQHKGTWTGNLVQEFGLTLDNPTDRALFELGTLSTERRTAIVHHDSWSMLPNITVCYQQREWQHTRHHVHSGAMEIEQQCICFSPTMKKPYYCQRSWLFGDPSAMQKEWANGVSGNRRTSE